MREQTGNPQEPSISLPKTHETVGMAAQTPHREGGPRQDIRSVGRGVLTPQRLRVLLRGGSSPPTNKQKLLGGGRLRTVVTARAGVGARVSIQARPEYGARALQMRPRGPDSSVLSRSIAEIAHVASPGARGAPGARNTPQALCFRTRVWGPARARTAVFAP